MNTPVCFVPRWRIRALVGFAVAASCAQFATAADLGPDSPSEGSVFIASAEGISVFNRNGTMPFGHFVTSLQDGKPGPVEYDDMVYDGWILDSGNYLCSSHRYVRELSPDGTTVWEFRLDKPSELKTCVPLPNGDVMTVDAERMELVQLTDKGKREARRIPVPTAKEATPHNRYNLLRRTAAGTFLLALRHEKAFIEVDETGKELWRHPVPDLPVVAERLDNGNTLMTWSGGILEVAPNHDVVWELKKEDIADFPVTIFGGFHRFPNGNTLIANSDWHYKEAGENRVQMFEITPDKKVVWKLTTDDFAAKKPGSLEPSTGLVEHRIIGIQWLENQTPSPEKIAAVDGDFFTTHVQPVLAQRCYECHSHANKIKGGLALDSRSGLEKGGEGGAIFVAGDPAKSRIIKAIEYGDADFQMPPKQKLSDAEIAVLVEWVKLGAQVPESHGAVAATANAAGKDWDAIYRERLTWWSLQPIAMTSPPTTKDTAWPRNDIDRFVLAGLEAKGLAPVAQADRRVLARRLSFALTGLPPKPEDVERFVADTSPDAYDKLVQFYLDSPHFGEQWARHWMDVVHYSDTHGYEWDTPAKNAWMYRDYLIRAFNADVPFKQQIVEQIAGDLIEPRIDPATGLNECIIAPTAMRLGERRHGDNADAEGVTQEAMTNIIDTLSKGFLATTVACAQCHDHKLDAVAQRDYFGLAGVFMSSRWISRTADMADPNLATIAELKAIKDSVRDEISETWQDAQQVLNGKIAATTIAEDAKPVDPKAKPKPPAEPAFPDSMLAIWRRVNDAAAKGETVEAAWTKLAQEFKTERDRRVAENAANLRLVADFTQQEMPEGWQVDGFGMKYGLVDNGEIVVADEGDAVVAHVLPAGRWTNVWSARIAGALRGPLVKQDPAPTLSVGYAAGRHAAESTIVDNCFHSERMKFLNQPTHGWLTLATGNLPALAGGSDKVQRRVYLEFVTKALNNYFPPRTAYGGLKEADESDPRSWFGVTRVYEHAAGKPPLDELGRFESLFAGPAPTKRDELAARLSGTTMAAIEHWSTSSCDSNDVELINEALSAKWLPNEALSSPALALLVARYRETERKLVPDRVVGSVADWNDGKDEPIGVRGSYTVFAESAPRGNISFLGGPVQRAREESSGRLELARSIASDDNPLTARVFVNRVWYHLYGAGIVRTVDDFGHLGEAPSHPELLDWLAQRFIEDGWSLKKLITVMVTSATWQQSSIANEAAVTADPENRLWHHMPMRRLQAESIRDSMLAVSGRLDETLYGPPIEPFRAAADPAKRLAIGPLDGNGRRSIYTEMTLMEPPRFLALFNQPIPKLTTGKRDTTNVPDQALALLNDPFVIAMAKQWSEQALDDDVATPEIRISRMFESALARPPQPDETQRLTEFAESCARLRGASPAALMSCQPVWQDVAHAIFNLKEFIYVP
jgi:hypothetical protein